MDNMSIFNAVRSVPENAKKPINAGRLRGMTDINPIWRIQTMTEQFGPCGVGWKYVIRNKHMEQGANGEIAAFVDIDLFYKLSDGSWSEAIPGTGGASFVAKEKNGLYVSDECYKMALTDALSVACKSIGMGADVYWSAGRTKYDNRTEQAEQSTQTPPTCSDCKKQIKESKKRDGSTWTAADIVTYSTKRFGRCLCPDCQRKAYASEQGNAQ